MTQLVAGRPRQPSPGLGTVEDLIHPLGDEQPRSPVLTSSRRRPSTSQRRSPPSTIASTMARSPWVCGARISASTSSDASTRSRVRGGSDQRHTALAPLPAGAAGREAARHPAAC